MISTEKVVDVLPAEDRAPDKRKLAVKVSPFHTDSLIYSLRERGVYHDRRDCAFGQTVRGDGNAVPGRADRRRCDRCADLDEGVDDLFPGDFGRVTDPRS